MSDEELSKYIPLHGERLRVKKFIREKGTKRQNGKRSALLKVLQEKIETKRNKSSKGKTAVESTVDETDDEMRESNRRFGNQNASKDMRKVEIGWIHKTSKKSIQIRSRRGGGTRRIAMQKNATKKELLDEGKKLFFPNGKSPQGIETDFDFDLWDYQDRTMNEEVTIGQMYRETKMPILRFYLASIEKDCITVDEHSASSQDDNGSFYSAPSQDDTDRFTDPIQPATASKVDIVSEAMQLAGIETEEIGDITEERPLVTDEYTEDLNIQPPTGDRLNVPITESLDIPMPTADNTDNDSIMIQLHRGQIMKEMIDNFIPIQDPMSQIIKLQLIMPNGELEAAEDAGGVTRDILVEFWTSFYDECTLGSSHKVPCLRHDFGQREWLSVAKIIAFGWCSVKYFPIKLSPIFMQYCMYGRFSDNILDSFFKYIPENDAKTLRAALDDVSSVDEEELYDIFSQFDLKRVPRQTNMDRIIREMAHKELIQAAMFVSDCWYPVLRGLHLPVEKLLSLYKDLIPNPRRVLSLLKFPDDLCADGQTTSNHLKRFIRGLDDNLLTRFLRFCTGADLLTEGSITVSFVDVQGVQRQPVAHTCSSMLELPKKYDNYLQFRSEFSNVLKSDIWIMDII
ncbi:hypothetical protein FSP39_010956 [Pinctada imbricata]|uniref:HECT domain-containing protein n=1 Tax=Pinctada imbricata TaxID=66713 RepID=A0AA88YDX8_PINIB|nr:hypothetical protein FSP39_010956 [Pinctada imbricata]